MTRTYRALSLGAIGLALLPTGWWSLAAELPTPPVVSPAPARPAVPAPPPPADGKDDAATTATPREAPAPVPSSVLNGRVERADQPGGVALGQLFESTAGDIALGPPADAKPLREVGKNEIVQFQNAD